jgi:hypothetical protein
VGAAAPTSTEEIARELLRVVVDFAVPLSDPEWGMSFSAVVLLCQPDAVSVAACGMFAVRLISGGSSRFLFRPRKWIEQAVEEGAMTTEQAATFPHREIFAGPFLGVGVQGVMEEVHRADATVSPGDRIAVYHYLYEDLPDATLSGVSSAAQLAAARAERRPAPAVLIDW